jgi:hypothetical protein
MKKKKRWGECRYDAIPWVTSFYWEHWEEIGVQ